MPQGNQVPTVRKKLDERYEAMDFQRLMETRYSVRNYRSDAVAEDQLQAVLEAARLAPTAANKQPFQVIVIHTAGRTAELKRIYHPAWFAKAPIVLAVVALPKQAWRRSDGKNYADVDAAIVMDHMILAAADAGLGTCWIGAFDPAAAREVLGLPDDVEPIAFTPLGHAADIAPVRKRKPLEKLVRHARW